MFEPRRFSPARIAFFACVERAASLLGGRRFYRWRSLRADRIAERDEHVLIEGLPKALDGFCIAHVSDPHAGPFLRAGDLDAVCARIEARQPDLVCATGDYLTHSVDDVAWIEGELGRMVGRLGTFAVFGNHDYVERREGEIEARMRPAGWRFLRNAGVKLDVDGAVLGVCGIEDPEEGKEVDPDAAIEAVSPSDVILALSHGPVAAPRLAELGARIILSGHTHGRQIDLPVLRHLGPPHPGLRIELGDATLLVTRGLGVVGVPLRVGSPAEVVFVTLRRSNR